MCTCPSSHHALIQRECVLPCCDKYPIIVIPSQEVNEETKQ